MNFIRSLVLTLSLTTLSFSAFADHGDQAAAWFANNVGADLLYVQRNDVAGRSAKEIKKMNDASFDMLNHFEPKAVDGRVNSISRDFAELALSSINQHPVVSEYNLDNYPNGHQIGFCFGRATYVHIAMLRAGINKRSIKKIWAVGPMKTGDTHWQFHVATIVKADDGSWYVIDTFAGRIVTPEEWFKTMQGVALDKTLRFYVSEPGKFSVSLSTYDRIQLGLDLDKSQDWYSHYFKDLMTWMATKPLSDVGLYDLRKTDDQSTEDDN